MTSSQNSGVRGGRRRTNDAGCAAPGERTAPPRKIATSGVGLQHKVTVNSAADTFRGVCQAADGHVSVAVGSWSGVTSDQRYSRWLARSGRVLGHGRPPGRTVSLTRRTRRQCPLAGLLGQGDGAAEAAGLKRPHVALTLDEVDQHCLEQVSFGGTQVPVSRHHDHAEARLTARAKAVSGTGVVSGFGAQSRGTRRAMEGTCGRPATLLTVGPTGTAPSGNSSADMASLRRFGSERSGTPARCGPSLLIGCLSNRATDFQLVRG